MLAKSEDLDQTPHHVVSDLGLYSLPMSHKKDAMLIKLVKISMHNYPAWLHLQSFGLSLCLPPN